MHAKAPRPLIDLFPCYGGQTLERAFHICLDELYGLHIASALEPAMNEISLVRACFLSNCGIKTVS